MTDPSNSITYPTGKTDAAKPVFYGFANVRDDIGFLRDRQIKSAPGINDPDNILDKNRDWEYSYIHPTEGFMGVRWHPSWIRTDTQLARWQPAGTDVYRVQRKGEAGADVRTLVFTTGPNSLSIPTGDPVVVWDATNDTTVSSATTRDLSGYSLQLKTKLTVSDCTPSALYDINGRRIIEIDTGVTLPVIDYIPPFFSGENGISKSTLQLRHWSFYANAADKTLRLPFLSFFNLTKRAVNSGGVVILGGNRWAPTNYDWSKDYINFGSSLVEELYTKECQALAYELGNTPPSRLAVELEARVVHGWNNVSSIPGFKTLLNDVWYPIARQAWGQERTLIVKGPGGVNGTLNDFDWSPPKGERAHLCVTASDSGIVGPDGAITFANITESDWLAGALRDKIDALGFAGGGVVGMQVNAPQDTQEKAKRLGRVLTSCNNKNLYTFYYCHMNANPDTTINVADVFVINGQRMEAVYPEMRAYASRAGQVTA